MRITITGASGFVGSNLSEYLEEKGDIIERLSLKNTNWTINNTADSIIHLAGKAHDTSKTSTEEEYFNVNTELTKKVFKQFLSSEIRDFFYFSSVKATADTISGVLTEDHLSNPQTPYGKSKLAAEEYLLGQKIPSGKRLFIIRPSMIHGPGNKGNLNLLYNVVEKGIPWPLAAFKNKRSFLSIDNLNFMIECMLKDTSIPSGIYNFADDKSISTNDLVKIISEVSNKKPILLKVPANVIQIFAKVGDLLRLPLNSERLKKLTESYEVSNQKIKNALKINNLPMSAEDGLVKTIQSFKQ